MPPSRHFLNKEHMVMTVDLIKISTCAKSTEIFCRLWNYVSFQFHDNPTGGLPTDGNVEKDLWFPHLLTSYYSSTSSCKKKEIWEKYRLDDLLNITAEDCW